MTATPEQIIEALRPVEDPELHRSIVDLGMVRDVAVTANGVSLTVVLTVAGCPMRNEIQNRVNAAIVPMAPGGSSTPRRPAPPPTPHSWRPSGRGSRCSKATVPPKARVSRSSSGAPPVAPPNTASVTSPMPSPPTDPPKSARCGCTSGGCFAFSRWTKRRPNVGRWFEGGGVAQHRTRF